jgi:hypothetical protein
MNIFLQFSDGAKFADLARNLINGFGYGNSFTFFGGGIFDNLQKVVFPAPGILPVMPFTIAAFFKVLGVNDVSVITASIFYFLLTLIFVFLLAKKVFRSNLVAILSTIVVGFNKDLINYATSGASESPFIFEIVAATYFISVRKKWANIVAVVMFLLMYFTRPQSFIYIAGLIFYWLLLNFKTKKAILIFCILAVAGVLFDHFVLYRLSLKYPVYSITVRGMDAAVNVVSGGSTSDSLRGGAVAPRGIVILAKKIFYNLYNFYKLLPDILNPYLVAIFIIGLAKKSKNRTEYSFKTASILMMVLTFLVAAASIPFFRYLHPVIPLIYIVAIATMIEITKTQIANLKQFTIYKLQISKQTLLVFASCVLIFFFGVGQTLGIYILDSRFVKTTHNIDKPPVYALLSKIMKDNTNPNDIIITSLDTWGSWYGERTTVWFPVEPAKLIDSKTNKIPFDAIYLTDYLMDDQNNYMGVNWRVIFNNPKNPEEWACNGCVEIAEQFELKGIYYISKNDNYERLDARSVLLVKKNTKQ